MTDQVERPKYLLDLLDEVDRWDASLYAPKDPVEKDETPVGTLSPWCQKTYSLARYFHKQAKLLAVERDYASEEDVGDNEIDDLKYKRDLLMEIVWAVTRAELNQYGNAPYVGIRVDWTVIRSEVKDDDQGFKAFLAHIMRRK